MKIVGEYCLPQLLIAYQREADSPAPGLSQRNAVERGSRNRRPWSNAAMCETRHIESEEVQHLRENPEIDRRKTPVETHVVLFLLCRLARRDFVAECRKCKRIPDGIR